MDQQGRPNEPQLVYRRDSETGRPVEGLLRWGLIPHFCEKRPDFAPIHARAETVAENEWFGAVFQKKLAALADHPLVGEVRGAGLIAGLELVAEKATRRPFPTIGKVATHAYEVGHDNGLIVRAIGDTIALCPPLIITEQEVGELVRRLEITLDRTAEWVRSEGLHDAKNDRIDL